MKDAIIDDVSKQLHEKGMRLTNPRREVVELFISSKKLQTPQEIFELAREKKIDVGLTTVYRMINALMEVGLARAYSIKGELRYIFCSPDHHYHLICTECLKVQDVFNCPIGDIKIKGFKVQSHQLDFFGVCEDCQNK
uniref:Transcriptional repressor n=1 Tax=Mesoaciditoga lauensis TaxID=1495039 RepID=A0A7V3REB7_9BACT